MSVSILIVDDVPTNIRLVASILADYDYELSFANSGPDALRQIETHNFDLILLDIMMPGMDGFAVAKILKQEDSPQAHIPIIFLTARSDEDSIVTGFEVGAADYITKPFTPSELIARVHTHITLKQTRDQLLRRNRELDEVIQLKNQLLSIASHDLKNPLSAVNGFARMLQNRPAIQADTTSLEMAQYISRAAERMNQLITELLDTAALELGKIELSWQNFSLATLVEDVLKASQPQLEAKSQMLACQGNFNTQVQADPERIKQVLENLLSNAIKYSPAQAHLSLDLTLQGDWLELRMRDQGPGFSEQDRAKLFGYFQRLSARPTAGESSTGVGLAIVKQIVEMHGGQIRLEASSEKGSTFLVRLPLQPQTSSN